MTRRSGFTVIEIMMALAVLTVAATGIFAMQQAVMAGNMDAREMTTASAFANTWAERLRRDALRWNAAGTDTLASTQYLNSTPAMLWADSGWFVPVPEEDDESYMLTYAGEDTRTLADARFCVNVRTTWMIVGQAMRADVRVWWPRRGSDADSASGDLTLMNNCAPGSEWPITWETFMFPSRVRTVQTMVLLRWSPL